MKLYRKWKYNRFFLNKTNYLGIQRHYRIENFFIRCKSSLKWKVRCKWTELKCLKFIIVYIILYETRRVDFNQDLEENCKERLGSYCWWCFFFKIGLFLTLLWITWLSVTTPETNGWWRNCLCSSGFTRKIGRHCDNVSCKILPEPPHAKNVSYNIYLLEI